MGVKTQISGLEGYTVRISESDSEPEDLFELDSSDSECSNNETVPE